MADRPTTDVRAVVLDSFEQTWNGLMERIGDLSRDEYLWEPVAGCWSVRVAGDDDPTPRVEGFGVREVDPAPVTTIAWRLSHIAVDCLDSYSWRVFGRTGAAVAGDAWYLEPGPAVADCERAWSCFRGGLSELDVEGWWRELGPEWGPFAQRSVFDLAMHALREVTHHAAEIALLRDLYRWRDL